PRFPGDPSCAFAPLYDPGRTDDPSPLDGFVDAAPALPTAKASAVDEFRGSITRLWHLLPTLQERCCHHPCKTHFRLAGSPLPGGRRPSGSLQKGSGYPSSFSGLGLAQGKFHGVHVCSPPGRRTVNTEPLPGALVTVTSPPIMRASLRERARPS